PCLGFAFDKSTTLTRGCIVSLLLNALYSLIVSNLLKLSMMLLLLQYQNYPLISYITSYSPPTGNIGR
ncbi:MAG: hypothetical protein ACXVBT_12600, partial [Flavisolibacter sp.]